MADISCFGEILVDLFAAAPSSPGAPRVFVEHAGGAPANVSVAAARLGARARFVGMLGSDMFADGLLQALKRHGVDTGGVHRTDQAPTALAFVALDAAGERSFSFRRPPAADLLFRARHFQVEDFPAGGWFHVCSNSLTDTDIADATCEGMQRARDAGALVSMDLNLRPMLWPQGVASHDAAWRALVLADLVKLSAEELDWLASTPGCQGPADALDRLLSARARCVVVTDGAAPLHWHTRSARGSVAGFDVKMQDSTGAGDAFVGGLLVALREAGVDAARWADFCMDLPALHGALRFAAAAGALAVTRQGAFAAMPSRHDVESLLRQAPGVDHDA